MKEYKKILDELKDKNIDINKLYIFDCLISAFEWNNPQNNFYNLNEKEQEIMINFVYNAWLKCDYDISISLISDKAAENSEEILNNKLTYYDVLNACYNL